MSSPLLSPLARGWLAARNEARASFLSSLASLCAERAGVPFEVVTAAAETVAAARAASVEWHGTNDIYLSGDSINANYFHPDAMHPARS